MLFNLFPYFTCHIRSKYIGIYTSRVEQCFKSKQIITSVNSYANEQQGGVTLTERLCMYHYNGGQTHENLEIIVKKE